MCLTINTICLIIDNVSDTHRKEEIMTNKEALKKAIEDSGVTITFIANKLGCTRNRVYSILNGADCSSSEIVTLTEVLHLSMKSREMIFFAQKCE